MTDPTINTSGGIEDDIPTPEEPTRDGDIVVGVEGVPDEDATIANDGQQLPMHSSDVLAYWPEESREAAQLVVDKYGEPHESTASQLTWFAVGEWKRVVATKALWEHRFPAPHYDSVESIIDYRVAPDLFSALAQFDGSVVARRTMGELSATCHDEEANRLALNLAHDLISGDRDVPDARAYYSKEFTDSRRKAPTPYMQKLHFAPQSPNPDPDVPTIDEEELHDAEEEGQRSGGSTSDPPP